MLVDIHEMDEICAFVIPADRKVGRREHFPQLVADDVDDRLKIELGGKSLLDRIDDRELGIALLGFLEQALRLVEQSRVLQRHAHAGGHGAEQPRIGLVECAFALVVLDGDAAERPIAADDRYEHDRLARVRSRNRADAKRRTFGARSYDQRLPILQRLPNWTVGEQRSWRRVDAHAVFVLIEVLDKTRGWVAPANADVVSREDFAQLVPDEIDDALEVELGGDTLLDAIDDRKLGCALLGFLEQALRFVEQPRVLECDAQAAGKRDQQPEITITECVLAIDVLNRNYAPRLVADVQRYPDA